MKFLSAALILCFLLPASAEEFVLKNGKVVEGTIWKEIGGTVILKGPDGILLNIKKEEIDQEKTAERKKSGAKQNVTAARSEEQSRARPPKKISKEYLESIREKYDLGQGSYGEAYEINLPVSGRSSDFSPDKNPEFEKNVLKASTPVIVDFWAEWCGPCRQIKPYLDSLEKEFQDRASVYRVNIDKEQQIAYFYKVFAIPTLLYFNKGEEVDRIVGAASQEVITAHLKPLLNPAE